MNDHPLAEVFGFTPFDDSQTAIRHRNHRLCPFNNVEPNCTKDKKSDPLGICSIGHGEQKVIVCPIRFRENWAIATDAAAFFFPPGAKWTSLSEARLNDIHGHSVGKIDHVLVSYDDKGLITDYGALEVQSVYISGNIRSPFEEYMQDRTGYKKQDWSRLVDRPKPDFLSSRKRMIPQLLSKSRILRTWGRKMAVAVDKAFFQSLPTMREVADRTADLAWLVYEFGNTSSRSIEFKPVSIFLTTHEELSKLSCEAPPDIQCESEICFINRNLSVSERELSFFSNC